MNESRPTFPSSGLSPHAVLPANASYYTQQLAALRIEARERLHISAQHETEETNYRTEESDGLLAQTVAGKEDVNLLNVESKDFELKEGERYSCVTNSTSQANLANAINEREQEEDDTASGCPEPHKNTLTYHITSSHYTPPAYPPSPPPFPHLLLAAEDTLVAAQLPHTTVRVRQNPESELLVEPKISTADTAGGAEGGEEERGVEERDTEDTLDVESCTTRVLQDQFSSLPPPLGDMQGTRKVLGARRHTSL